jgi:CO/xanthine dehydrogenase FAD-binding subunit
MISLTCALDGECTIWRPDGIARRVLVADFVTGAGQCVLRPGELLRSVHLPASALDDLTAFRQLSLSPLGRSASVVIGRRPAAGDGGGPLVITVTAATTRPVQLRFPAPPGPDALLAGLADAGCVYHEDAHGSAEWREAITRHLALEVLDEMARL